MTETLSPSKTKPKVARWWQLLLRILLPLVIAGAGIGGAAYVRQSTPPAKKRRPPAYIPAVQVQPLSASDRRVVVGALGTVVPARQVVLASRVSGEVVALHPEFTEGGLLPKGAVAVTIDLRDYQLEQIRAQAAVAAAQYALKLEEGHQAVARREWKLLKTQQPEQRELDLALRKPHLAKARAELAAAQAQLDRTQLDLDRTRITAPFNAMVRSKKVEIGSMIAPQSPLAELIGTDAYHVLVALPTDRLEWIRIPRTAAETGSPARILQNGRAPLAGRVVRLMADLTAEGRMAQILVGVKDPLGLRLEERPPLPLLIGAYVRVEIEGRRLENVFHIPQTALRDRTTVWIAGKDGRLEIRPVTPVWRDPETVALGGGVGNGELLIVSDLPAPVDGMAVRVERPAPGASQEAAAKPAPATENERGAAAPR
jgi:RND family efflux transporter MFP subunit